MTGGPDVEADAPRESLDAPATPAATPAARISRRWDPVRLAERYGLVVLWGVSVAIFSLLAPATFPTIANFSTIFGTQAVLLVLALGLLISLSVGEFDLSVAATMGFATVLVALLSAQDHWPLPVAIVATIAVGLVIGGVNALLVVRGGISSFVVTLGTGTLLTGLGYGMSNSETIGGVPSALVTATNKQFLDLPLA